VRCTLPLEENMSDLQDSLIRAGSVARLDSLISSLETQGTSFVWEEAERDWFCSLLLPFSPEPHMTSRLAGRPDAAALDPSAIIAELLSADHDSPEELAHVGQELTGLAQLFSRLCSDKPTLDSSDLERALRVAITARRSLLSDAPRSASFGDTGFNCAWL
jgi:hypothetical protein